MANSDTRANIIKGAKLDQSLIEEAEKQSVSSLEARNDGGEYTSGSVEQADAELSGVTAEEMPGIPMEAYKNIKEHLPSEFFKQKKFFSGPLLPTEVCVF